MELGIGAGDVVQRPRIDDEAPGVPVDLDPDAVILVLHQQRRRIAGKCLVQRGDRPREHEAKRGPGGERHAVERARAGPHGHLPGIGDEQRRLPDRVRVPAEGLRDRRQEQSFPEPDPEIGGEDLHQELRLERSRISQERPEHRLLGPPGSGPLGRGDGAEGPVHRLQGERAGKEGRSGRMLVKEGGGGGAEVPVRQVDAVEILLGRPGDLRQDLGDRHPADLEPAGIAGGERGARQVAAGAPEVRLLQGGEVPAEPIDLGLRP